MTTSTDPDQIAPEGALLFIHAPKGASLFTHPCLSSYLEPFNTVLCFSIIGLLCL